MDVKLKRGVKGATVGTHGKYAKCTPERDKPSRDLNVDGQMHFGSSTFISPIPYVNFRLIGVCFSFEPDCS
jgi:hypothetical protein